MSDEQKLSVLEQSLVNVIEKATTGVEAGVDFLSEQVPDVVNQALLYYGVYHFTTFLVGIILLIAVAYSFKIYKKPDKIDPDGLRSGNYPQTIVYDKDGDLMPTIIATVTVQAITTIICLFEMLNLTWLKIWLAPKLWLIEYASSFVK